MPNETTKSSVAVIDEYREVKSDLRAKEKILVKIFSTWWLMNAAMLGTLLTYTGTVIEELRFYFGLIAVFMNFALVLHVWDVTYKYHQQTKWISDNIIDTAPQASKIFWILDTEKVYRILAIGFLIIWLWFWIPSWVDVFKALSFPLG